MNKQKNIEDEINQIISMIKKVDSEKLNDRDAEIKRRLVSIGESAVLPMIELLENHDTRISSALAADVLGEIGDERAIVPLSKVLEHPDLGENASKALIKLGPACISEVIKTVENRIAHPVTTGTAIDLITENALTVIGEIKCEQSIIFLTNLLDNYMAEIPDEAFDPTQHEWKYRNVDFFHLLDCLVKQQDKKAIPHIEKARDFFPKEYTDHIICQIAIGRIKDGVTEGYLPGEAMDISMPSGRIMDILSGGEFGWENDFDEQYGKYLDEK